jgi:hypothetical protein
VTFEEVNKKLSKLYRGPDDTFVRPPRSPLKRIVVPAPVGIAGDAGVYVPPANLKSTPIALEGGLTVKVNSVVTSVYLIVEPVAGVGIYY